MHACFLTHCWYRVKHKYRETNFVVNGLAPIIYILVKFVLSLYMLIGLHSPTHPSLYLRLRLDPNVFYNLKLYQVSQTKIVK